jgi:hypothetical protein
MDSALIGVAGVAIGTALGGTNKYFSERRDAWKEARTSGLLLLADVRALREAQSTAQIVSDTRLGVKSWESHRQVLAGFRRGRFPNGFLARDWLKLANHFAHLEQLYAERQSKGKVWWSRAQTELEAAESLLARFEFDPRVVGYVLSPKRWLEPKQPRSDAPRS